MVDFQEMDIYEVDFKVKAPKLSKFYSSLGIKIY